MSRVSHLCFSAVLGLVLLAGCGSDGSTDEATPKKDDSGVATIDITFEGDTVKPQGARVEVVAGEPVKLRIDADQGGELHVHSSPEQELEYSAGTTEQTITLDQPGVVDVESHDLEQLIVQLEVR